MAAVKEQPEQVPSWRHRQIRVRTSVGGGGERARGEGAWWRELGGGQGTHDEGAWRWGARRRPSSSRCRRSWAAEKELGSGEGARWRGARRWDGGTEVRHHWRAHRGGDTGRPLPLGERAARARRGRRGGKCWRCGAKGDGEVGDDGGAAVDRATASFALHFVHVCGGSVHAREVAPRQSNCALAKIIFASGPQKESACDESAYNNRRRRLMWSACKDDFRKRRPYVGNNYGVI
uniref:Uncharacterized protein n=1 Tax=Oryza barthii TaxID=65489 RepID=A0A0D3FSA6_9ORYZ